MHDAKTTYSLNVAPKKGNSNESHPASDEPESIYSPSKVFKRHHSLAELSSVAVFEKETLDKESSQNSDRSKTHSSQSFDSEEYKYNSTDSQNTCAITTQGCHHGSSQTVPQTPTKMTQVEGPNCEDPLTPTANLKMLMSVVSPAIRDREEKKKDLFYTDGEKVAEEVTIKKTNVYNRKDKSLGLLCQRFLEKFPENPGENPIEICLDEVSKDLKVERRRVYDIVNVLESVEVLSRMAKNRYLWHGKTRIAQTLGKLKVLSRTSEITIHGRNGKENPCHTSLSTSKVKEKMKRHFSSGDMPKRNNLGTVGENQMLKEQNLTKEAEHKRIKAVIESTDNSRKDKSLGVLSQKFLIMFLMSKGGIVTLEDAANVLLEEHDEGNVKYKTKVRRLYDIANILSSLRLIEKVHIRATSGKKPGFKWIGVDIDNLPENMMLTGHVLTFKTKHSLLPDQNMFVEAKHSTSDSAKKPLILPSTKPADPVHTNSAGSKVRWSRSVSSSASLTRRSSTADDLLKGEKSENASSGSSDGFPVHEFASSPVDVLGRDMSLYSPTEITFREEIQKLQQKFPNRMSQLFPVLPFNPSSPGSAKKSRRNLFCNNRNPSARVAEPDPKRLRVNSVGDFKASEGSSSITVNSKETSRTENPSQSIEKKNESEKHDGQTRFMHSSNSPFKVMAACAYGQVNNPPNNNEQTNIINYNECQVLEERRKQQTLLQKQRIIYQSNEPQWPHVVGHLRSQDHGSSPRMPRLVDQAVSPIPPSKMVPRASIAVQTNLIKDISPLKPLVILHRHIPSPWKPPGVSPSSVPPAPPCTPELPNELATGPFQSQANKVYVRSVSPYPVSGSQSCNSSPVGSFNGPKLFFPPSPTTPTSSINSLVLPQAGLFYNVNQAMSSSIANITSPQARRHSNSCPPSVNLSPTPIDPNLPYGSGVAIPGPRTQNSNVDNIPVVVPLSMPQQTSEKFFNNSGIITSSSQAANLTPYQHGQHHPADGYLGLKHPCMMVNQARGSSETPSTNMEETFKDGVSRKLHLTGENS